MTADPSFLRMAAENKDAMAVLAALHHAAFAEFDERPWTSDALRQLVASPGLDACIRNDGDRPVGFLLWRTVLDEAEIISIGVAPDHRHRGHARKLLDFLVHVCTEQGVARLFLEVRTDNVGAINLYRSFGFTEIGQRPGYYQTQSGKRVDAICLKLSLNNEISGK